MKRDGTHHVKMIGVHDLRDINQTIFLHLIRDRQPISRADIVKATGLQPGTVSAIVNRLIKQKLIYEGVEGPSSGGRPPKYLHVNAESAYVLAIDLGVKQSVYAVSDFNGRILTQRSVLTGENPESFLRSLSREIDAVVKTQYPRARVEAVGVSVPGLVDRAAGTAVLELTRVVPGHALPLRLSDFVPRHVERRERDAVLHLLRLTILFFRRRSHPETSGTQQDELHAGESIPPRRKGTGGGSSQHRRTPCEDRRGGDGDHQQADAPFLVRIPHVRSISAVRWRTGPSENGRPNTAATSGILKVEPESEGRVARPSL